MRSLRRTALILLVVGILGVVVFLATRSSEPRAVAPAQRPNAAVVETRSEPGAASASAPTDDRVVVSPLVGDAPAAVDENAGWRVRVLEASTNAAVAGATVSVNDSNVISREISERGLGPDTIEGLRLRRERAVESTTGADGCASFAAPPKSAMVEARFGAEYAFTVVNQVPEGRCVTLKLVPDRPLLVRVVEAAGTPVGGVPVALRGRKDARSPFTWKWTDTEAVSGIATFLHFQRRLEQGTGWHALLAFPVRDQKLSPVDADTPLDPPVTLLLPDTGRVRVRVRAVDGSLPDLERIELHLDAFEGASQTTRLWPDGPWARPHVDAQGEALVPWIGLGLQIKAALIRDGEDEVVARSIAGPTLPGEEVLCELVWSATSLRVVRGRFVFRDGRPWPATKVSAFATLFPTPTSWIPPREIDVGSDGRFSMPVHEARPANGTRAFRFSASHPDGRGEVIAVVPLDVDLPPEGLDLGDVLLDYGELLLSGRVVDTALRPITGANVWVSARAMVSGKEYWSRISTSGSSPTGEDGAFALYLQPGDEQPSEQLRLETIAKGFIGERGREVRRGDRNVEVVLTQAGALAGSLELEHGLVPAEVLVLLSSDERPDERRNGQLKNDASFEIPELLPGTYSLDVRRLGANGQFEHEPAVRVDNLLVLAGETCRDPRIQGLRIESLLTTLRIRVVDRSLTPLKSAAISIVGHRDVGAALSSEDGVCRLACESLPADLDVSAFGYQRQRLMNVSADREVVLDAGFPIRLRTSAKPSGGEPKYMLGVFLYSVDANGVTRGMAWGPEYMAGYGADRVHFDEHGELALRMPAAGVYECDVSVTVLAANVGRGGHVEISPKPRITVLASFVEQLFELSIPEDAVKEAVERALRQ